MCLCGKQIYRQFSSCQSVKFITIIKTIAMIIITIANNNNNDCTDTTISSGLFNTPADICVIFFVNSTARKLPIKNVWEKSLFN